MSTPEFDLVIKGARVVDGTGLPAYVADVGVKGDRIAKIGRIDPRLRARSTRRAWS